MLCSAHRHLEPGAHAKGRSNRGWLRLPRPVLQGSPGDLGGWNSPSGVRDAQPESYGNLAVCSRLWEICFDFLSYFPMTRFISKESYCKTLVFQLRHDHSSSTGHFGLNSNPQKMNPLELSSQNVDGFRTRKMQRWNIGPVMLKNVAKFFS